LRQTSSSSTNSSYPLRENGTAQNRSLKARQGTALRYTSVMRNSRVNAVVARIAAINAAPARLGHRKRSP
jgi:phage portal protein BeeE